MGVVKGIFTVAVIGSVSFVAALGLGAAFGPAAAGTLEMATNGIQVGVSGAAEGFGWTSEAINNAMAEPPTFGLDKT